jgi:hypothetical protein
VAGRGRRLLHAERGGRRAHLVARRDLLSSSSTRPAADTTSVRRLFRRYWAS